MAITETQEKQSVSITKIRVDDLFGLYSYQIPRLGIVPASAAILYGHNGSGKSTILRLVFHLLSPADNRGHRTALWDTAFDLIEVTLSSGHVVRAKRVLQPKPMLTLTIALRSVIKAQWDYSKDGPRGRDTEGIEEFIRRADGSMMIVHKARPAARTKGVQYGEVEFLQMLTQIAPTSFILSSDRRLDSDAVSDPSDEVELRKLMQYETPKRIQDIVVRGRDIALSQALGTAGRWIHRKAIIGANRGATNVHSVYSNVLKQLTASTKSAAPSTLLDVAKIIGRLQKVSRETTDFALYEFQTELAVTDFVKALSVKNVSKQQLVAKLVEPYLESLEARLDALRQAFDTTNNFIKTVNEFLTDKAISFKLTQGFRIHNKNGQVLEPKHLSSGEQQLLLVFCYVLAGRDTPSLFIIDEPEISLNIEWQRRLIQALLGITTGASIQFLFASHSMELLAQHEDKLLPLQP